MERAMTLLWLVASFAALVALAAYLKARSVSRRLAQLTHSYWELRYQQGELRAFVGRLDPLQQQPRDSEAGMAPPGEAFVPLSTLKR